MFLCYHQLVYLFREQQHNYPIARGYSFARIAIIITETLVIIAIQMQIHSNKSSEKIKENTTPESESR